MTNVRIVFYVTAAEKATLTRISKQTGAPASERKRPKRTVLLSVHE
jgi:hypothetical protein